MNGEQKANKTNGKRNRTAGHNWERTLAKIFKAIGFPYVVTTRSESRSRDDQKIDLINKDEAVNGRLPYNVQAKCTIGHVKYGKLLDELPNTPNVTNVILHRQVEKTSSGRFTVTDDFAILYMKDFLEMVRQLNVQKHDCENVRGELVQPSKRRVGKTILPSTEGEPNKRI